MALFSDGGSILHWNILYEMENPFAVKYIILIGYNLLDFIHNIMIYYGSDAEFDGGNIVEGFLFYLPHFL